MASAKIRLQCGRVWLEVDANGVKDSIKALSEYQEVFAERTCGKCGSEEIAYEHRLHDSNDYYSLKCRNCGARLDFGQHKTGGTLFAKRKLENGEYDKEHRGWYSWQSKNGRSDHRDEF